RSTRAWWRSLAMAGWWHLLGVYVVAGVFAGVIGWRLLKADAPPGVAYVTFASFARHPQGGPEDVASPPNDGMPVQRRPCFAHDRRPGVEASRGAVCSCYRVVLERAA